MTAVLLLYSQFHHRTRTCDSCGVECRYILPNLRPGQNFAMFNKCGNPTGLWLKWLPISLPRLLNEGRLRSHQVTLSSSKVCKKNQNATNVKSYIIICNQDMTGASAQWSTFLQPRPWPIGQTSAKTSSLREPTAQDLALKKFKSIPSWTRN